MSKAAAWFDLARRELLEGAESGYIIDLLLDDGCSKHMAQELIEDACAELEKEKSLKS